VVPGVQIGDLAGGGMAAAIGVLAALVERDRTGRGRFVDTAMLDGVVSWLTLHAGTFLATGEEPARGAMPLSGGYACYRVYRCADDRWLTVGALEPQFWRALCGALGVPELVDEQFGPLERQLEMSERLEAIFAGRPRREWLEALAGLEVCVGPVNSLEEAFHDPQVVHRGMVTATGPGSPFRFDGAHPMAARPAPGFGEHTAEVLGEIGVTENQVAELRSRGVL
jgi:crotonobetainyl-CoA:carnitine CoA-transferase CaiB-like acyl-CoA transferase